LFQIVWNKIKFANTGSVKVIIVQMNKMDRVYIFVMEICLAIIYFDAS
jgi:hypothetical protein